jgi:hypothetical protein
VVSYQLSMASGTWTRRATNSMQLRISQDDCPVLHARIIITGSHVPSQTYS